MEEARRASFAERLANIDEPGPRDRGASRSPRGNHGGGGVSPAEPWQPPVANDTADAVADLFAGFNLSPTESNTIPKHVVDFITKSLRDLRSSLDSVSKEKKRFASLTEQYKVFCETTDLYPPQVKPFRSNIAATHLEDPWSLCASSPFVFQVAIPAGTSRRQVGSLVHRSCSKLWKSIEVEAQFASLRDAEAHLSGFKLKELTDSAISMCDQKDIAEESFGLVRPRLIPPTLISEVIQKKYEKLYIDFERSLKRQAQQAEETRKKLSDLDAQIAEMSPKDLFIEAVEASVQARLEKLGINVDMATDELDGVASAASSRFIESMSKNVPSPPAGVGHNYIRPSPKNVPKKSQNGSSNPQPAGGDSFHSGGRRGKKGPRKEAGRRDW